MHSTTLTKFLLWEQGVSLYMDGFICKYIWYLLVNKELCSYWRTCYVVAYCGAEVVMITSLSDDTARVYVQNCWHIVCKRNLP